MDYTPFEIGILGVDIIWVFFSNIFGLTFLEGSYSHLNATHFEVKSPYYIYFWDYTPFEIGILGLADLP